MANLPWNDPSIPDEDFLYRRVPARPDFYVHRDVLTGESVLGRNAFQFDDDGMSVYRQWLITKYGISLEQIRRDLSHLLFRFTVGLVRSTSAGVVDDPVDDDPPIGAAHASVRCENNARPPRQLRRTIQLALCANAELVQLDGSGGVG
jgi:hypothetical protein